MLKQFRHSVTSTTLVLIATILFSCTPAIRVETAPAEEKEPSFCTLYGSEEKKIRRSERFGFFTSRLWRGYESSLTAEIERFGVKPGFSLWYMGLDRPFPLEIALVNRKHRVRLVISHDIRHGDFGPAHNQRLLADIALGRWDGYFRQFARDARSVRRDIYYRFGYEMNGGWFPWGRKPEAFVAAWRRVHRIFQEEKADNVKWVFSPNVLWGKHTLDEHIHAYYPGNRYVDIVGLDGYNFGDDFDEWHSWRSFRDLFEESLQGISIYGKPIWIAEVGCVADRRRAVWITEMLAWLDENPCVEAFFWFDENKTGEPDFSLAGDPETLPLLQSWLGSDRPGITLISSIVAMIKSLPMF
ncbi:MAG: glycoside hydrolase family 26 protein [Chitinivibrionales bacterium]